MATISRILDILWGGLLGTAAVAGFWLMSTTVPSSHDRALAHLEARTRALPSLGAVYLPPKDDSYKREAILLENVVESIMNVDVRYEVFGDDLADFAGFTDLDPRQPKAIHVDKILAWTARLEVLSHEAGHRLQPPTLPGPSSESEVFAQAVSFLVCLEFGRDTLEASASYLAIHKASLHVLTDNRKEIEYAVTVLTGGLK